MSLLAVARPSIDLRIATAPGVGSRLSVAQDIDAPPGRPATGPTQLTGDSSFITRYGNQNNVWCALLYSYFGSTTCCSLAQSFYAYLQRPQDFFYMRMLEPICDHSDPKLTSMGWGVAMDAKMKTPKRQGS
jgi:hypothetical protein